MSLYDAERFGRRARGASTPQEVGDSVKRAIDALVSEIKNWRRG